jgi:hypothetical protein
MDSGSLLTEQPHDVMVLVADDGVMALQGLVAERAPKAPECVFDQRGVIDVEWRPELRHERRGVL